MRTCSRSGSKRIPSPPDEFAALPEVVAWIVENGGVPYLAHTYWSGCDDRVGDVRGLAGIEVWNAGCELEIGRGDSSLHWDEALERGRALFALATDDSHHPGYDSGFAWTMVRAAERSQEAVLDALRSGSLLRLDRTGRSTTWNSTTTPSSCAAARRRA